MKRLVECYQYLKREKMIDKKLHEITKEIRLVADSWTCDAKSLGDEIRNKFQLDTNPKWDAEKGKFLLTYWVDQLVFLAKGESVIPKSSYDIIS